MNEETEGDPTEQEPKATELSQQDLDKVAGGTIKCIDKASPKLYESLTSITHSTQGWVFDLPLFFGWASPVAHPA